LPAGFTEPSVFGVVAGVIPVGAFRRGRAKLGSEGAATEGRSYNALII
jgi:hypothetical protein